VTIFSVNALLGHNLFREKRAKFCGSSWQKCKISRKFLNGHLHFLDRNVSKISLSTQSLCCVDVDVEDIGLLAQAKQLFAGLSISTHIIL